MRPIGQLSETVSHPVAMDWIKYKFHARRGNVGGASPREVRSSEYSSSNHPQKRPKSACDTSQFPRHPTHGRATVYLRAPHHATFSPAAWGVSVFPLRANNPPQAAGLNEDLCSNLGVGFRPSTTNRQPFTTPLKPIACVPIAITSAGVAFLPHPISDMPPTNPCEGEGTRSMTLKVTDRLAPQPAPFILHPSAFRPPPTAYCFPHEE